MYSLVVYILKKQNNIKISVRDNFFIFAKNILYKTKPRRNVGVFYFHLKRVMANLQHMCLCECDHPLQIKTNY